MTILLDIVAPTLEYRHRILTVSHGVQLIYPATVDAAYFQPDIFSSIQRTFAGAAMIPGLRKEKQENEAASDTELIGLIEKVLGSPAVESLLLSLIALESDALEGGPAKQPSADRPSESKPEDDPGREAESSNREIPPASE